jgi:hypothetical protein
MGCQNLLWSEGTRYFLKSIQVTNHSLDFLKFDEALIFLLLETNFFGNLIKTFLIKCLFKTADVMKASLRILRWFPKMTTTLMIIVVHKSSNLHFNRARKDWQYSLKSSKEVTFALKWSFGDCLLVCDDWPELPIWSINCKKVNLILRMQDHCESDSNLLHQNLIFNNSLIKLLVKSLKVFRLHLEDHAK